MAILRDLCVQSRVAPTDARWATSRHDPRRPGSEVVTGVGGGGWRVAVGSTRTPVSLARSGPVGIGDPAHPKHATDPLLHGCSGASAFSVSGRGYPPLRLDLGPGGCLDVASALLCGGTCCGTRWLSHPRGLGSPAVQGGVDAAALVAFACLSPRRPRCPRFLALVRRLVAPLGTDRGPMRRIRSAAPALLCALAGRRSSRGRPARL